jgi:hypothetical protein
MPALIVNAADYTAVDLAESDLERTQYINARRVVGATYRYISYDGRRMGLPVLFARAIFTEHPNPAASTPSLVPTDTTGYSTRAPTFEFPAF